MKVEHYEGRGMQLAVSKLFQHARDNGGHVRIHVVGSEEPFLAAAMSEVETFTDGFAIRTPESYTVASYTSVARISWSKT
jgi:hypothetical protein